MDLPEAPNMDFNAEEPVVQRMAYTLMREALALQARLGMCKTGGQITPELKRVGAMDVCVENLILFHDLRQAMRPGQPLTQEQLDTMTNIEHKLASVYTDMSGPSVNQYLHLVAALKLKHEQQ